MIALADSMSGEYASEKLLCQHLLGRLKLEARERGWKGTFLLDADWRTGEMAVRPALAKAFSRAAGDELLKGPPILLVVIGPGHGDVSVDEVSRFIREKKRGKVA